MEDNLEILLTSDVFSLHQVTDGEEKHSLSTIVSKIHDVKRELQNTNKTERITIYEMLTIDRRILLSILS